jgi:hypothetical protein
MSETICDFGSLRTLSDEELALAYHQGDEATCKAVLDEAHRRDVHERDRARWAAVHSEWYDCAHAQYLAAEAQCRGNLLNRDGIEAGIDPWSLWSGSGRRAERYASEELRNFWDAYPRLTVSAFREQKRADRRAMRELAN